MSARTIFIKLTSTGIYYNDKEYIPYVATNLPINGYHISDRHGFYWLANMEGFKDGKLTVRIVNYDAKQAQPTFDRQQSKRPISRLYFEQLDLGHFKALCTNYTIATLKGCPVFGSTGTPTLQGSLATLSFAVPVKHLNYEAGRVTFRKKMRWQNEPIHFSIANSNILSEFMYVKNYIAKQLGCSKITVQIVAETIDNITTIKSCTSPQIAAIDQGFFQVLKFQKVQKESRAIFKKFASNSLLDINGYLNSEPDSMLHTLGMRGHDIIESILTKEGIRNRQHIDYLANVLHEEGSPLYITLSPHFGFLFVHRGTSHNHYLWEMLNSNATYIWSLTSTVQAKDQFDKITDIISFIRANGRRAYLSGFDLDKSIQFTRIYHSKVNSHVRDHFPYWKYKLEEALL